MADIFTGLLQLFALITMITATYALAQVILTIKEERDERRRRDEDAYARYIRDLEDWRANNGAQPTADVEPTLEPALAKAN